MLEDEETVADYQMKMRSTIHFLLKLRDSNQNVSLSEIGSTYDQYYDQPKDKVPKGKMLQATSDRLAGLDEDAEATFDCPREPEEGEEPTLEQNSTDRLKPFTNRRKKRKFMSDLFASRRARGRWHPIPRGVEVDGTRSDKRGSVQRFPHYGLLEGVTYPQMLPDIQGDR
jgi:hypothetical protein